MAYLNWNIDEDNHIEAQVAPEGDEPGRRCVGAIWRRIERGIEEQQLLYGKK